MKINGVVVNKNMEIVGFEMEGTEKEFGGMSNEIRIAPVRVDDLQQRMFKNRQIEFKADGTFEEKNGFKIKDTRMLEFEPSDGSIKPINNEIELKARVNVDGVTKGYDCIVSGKPFRLATDNIVRLSKMMKCKNFEVRYYDSGKAFLAGKTGMRLGELPEVSIGGGTATNKQKEQAKAVTNKSAVKGIVTPKNNKTFSVLELFDILHQINAKVVDLPTEEYKRSKMEVTKADSSFINFGTGGIGSPKLDYPDKSLNVNSKFNYVGTVSVGLTNGPAVLYPFIIKTKHIFFNGENHMKKFAIAVSSADKEMVEQTLGGALVLKPYSIPYVTQPLRAFMGDTTNSVLFYEIDTTNLDIIRGDVLSKAMLAPEDIRALTVDSIKQASLYAYLNKVNKSATEALAGKKQAPLYGPYAGLADNDLQLIQGAGINVYNGRFEKVVGTDAKTDEDAAKIRDMASGKEHTSEEMSNYEVEYQVKGMAGSLSYADVVALKDGKYTKKNVFSGIPELEAELMTLMKTIDVMGDIMKIQKYSDDMLKVIDKRKAEIRKTLWLHKMACFALGGYAKYNDGATQLWSPTKAIKDGAIYAHKTCNGLMVKISGGLELA